MAPPVLRADDHLLLRYYAAVMRVVHPVFVHVLQLLTKKKNLKKLLDDLPEYSKSKYRSDFNDKQRQHLDNNVASKRYDITLLFILLQKVGGLAKENDKKWSTPGTLENSLKQLKNHRNILAHEELSLTPEDLQKIVSNIEELCREVLELAGLRCRSLVTDNVKVMEEGLSEVLTTGVDLWEPYREALHNLQQEQCNILVREGKKEIKEMAKNLRILNPFVWLMEDNFAHLDVNHIFTDLYIEGQGPVNTKVFFTNPLPTGEYPDILITHGSPGIGKTSLTRYFIHDWLSDSPSTNGIDDFDIVLLVELRHVTSKCAQAMLCEEVLRIACRHLKLSDIIPTLREVSTLWLLDGYDEATRETKALVKEILKKFHNSKFMITTRTDCVNDLQMVVSELHRCQAVYHVRGFTPDKWSAYAEKLFSVSLQENSNIGLGESCRRFLQFMKEKEKDMWEIFSVPLFVVVLVVLWLEKPSAVTEATTVTRLYHILINHIINRMTRRLQMSTLSLNESQLRGKINCFLNLLGNIFWENSQRYKFSLNGYQIKEIEKLCEECGLPYKECMSPFFLVIVKSSTTGTREEYQPLHRTVQEFLAARAFCNAMITQGSDVLTIAAQWMVKHRENFTQYMPNEKAFMRLPNKIGFVMNKLCEGSNNVFDDYDFVERSMFSSNCFCPFELGISVDFGDPGESERHFCRQYFSFCVIGSLMMPFICGNLKLYNELTQKRAEQLIYVVICGQEKIRNYDLWLRLIDETDRDSVLLEELRSQISPYQWNPKPSQLPQVGHLLQFVTPESLLVHQCDFDSCTDDNLFDGLRKIARFPINISLDLRNGMHMERNSPKFTQDCLSLLLAPGASCRLIAFGGHLNKQSLSMLYNARHLDDLCVRVDTLEDLCVRVDTLEDLCVGVDNLEDLCVGVDNLEDLQTLAQITNSLQNLKNLCVFINFTFTNISYEVLPTFSIKHHITDKLSFAQVPDTPFNGLCLRFNDVLYFKPHKCTPPKVPSHKRIHRYVNGRRGGKMSYLCKPTLPALPYPVHLEGLTTSGIYEFCRTMWNLPSVHCHSRCGERHCDPVLCQDKCSHMQFRAPQPTKHKWFHCNKAIRYHKSCLKRLRSFYKILWTIIVENCKPSKETYTQSFDPNIKMFCYHIHDQQLCNNVWIQLNIFSLKVCELLMHEHKICIQQHRKQLTHVREPPVPVSSVLLAFIDPFILDAATFRSVVHKLCPNPFMVYALNMMSVNLRDTDIALGVLHLCQSFPSIKGLAIKNFMPWDSSSLQRVVETIERSAPHFIYSIYNA